HCGLCPCSSFASNGRWNRKRNQFMPSWFGTDWVSFVAASAAVLGVVFAFTFARRMMGWLLGPIFVWETVRLARKGSTFWLRMTAAILLLVVLYESLPKTPLEPPKGYTSTSLPGEDDEFNLDLFAGSTSNTYTRFASEFSNSFLTALAVAVMLI